MSQKKSPSYKQTLIDIALHNTGDNSLPEEEFKKVVYDKRASAPGKRKVEDQLPGKKSPKVRTVVKARRNENEEKNKLFERFPAVEEIHFEFASRGEIVKKSLLEPTNEDNKRAKNEKSEDEAKQEESVDREESQKVAEHKSSENEREDDVTPAKQNKKKKEKVKKGRVQKKKNKYFSSDEEEEEQKKSDSEEEEGSEKKNGGKRISRTNKASKDNTGPDKKKRKR